MQPACPTDDQLHQFVRGLLSNADTPSLREHLTSCRTCERITSQLLQEDSAWATPAGSVSDALWVQPGAQLGRYIVLRPIGAGGMGVVFAAYDPDLNRNIALKLLRAAESREHSPPSLLREAQALARLTHPNVLTVYDVGVMEGRVFIAMELVEGQTLRGWVHARPARDVLAAYVSAGRGLAAAHAASLVHRDFKPDNVLVGNDGRVHVTDFGLAQPTSWVAPERASSVGLEGTLAYLAPELHRGGRIADAKSDQFSFAVSVFEALHAGTPPYAGATAGERVLAAERGELAAFHPRLSSEVRRALARALNAQPEQRFASLNALLDALTPPAPTKTRNLVLCLAAVALVACAGFVARVLYVDHAQRCAGGAAQVGEVWSKTRRAAIRSAFEGTRHPFAAEALGQVEATVDAWTGTWTSAHREACEATRVRTEQPESVLSMRMRCLDRRLKALDRLTLLLSTADAAMVPSAVSATQGLPRIGTCAELETLHALAPEPTDPALRTEVDRVRTLFADVKAFQDLGKYPRALEIAQKAAIEAERLGQRSLQAEALLAVGRFEHANGKIVEAEKTLLRSINAAEASGHLEVQTRGWLELMLMTVEASRATEFTRHAGHAEAVLERLGSNRELMASFLSHRGVAAWLAGDYEQALGHHLKALALRQEGPVPTQHLASSLSRVGDTLAKLGRMEESAASYSQVLPLLKKVNGPVHPNVAGTLTNLGALAEERGLLEEAEQHARRAVEIFEATLSPDHVRLSFPLMCLGTVSWRKGRHEEAIGYFRRVIALREKAQPVNPDIAFALRGQARALRDLGRGAQALPLLERATKLYFDHPGDAYERATAAFELGRLLREQRRTTALSREWVERARTEAGLAPAGPRKTKLQAQIDGWSRGRPATSSGQK